MPLNWGNVLLLRLLRLPVPLRASEPTWKPVAAKVMSSIFKEVVRDKKIPRSPYVDIALPPVLAQAQFYMPAAQEIMKLADAMPGEMRLVVIVMAGCGLKAGRSSCAQQGMPEGRQPDATAQ